MVGYAVREDHSDGGCRFADWVICDFTFIDESPSQESFFFHPGAANPRSEAVSCVGLTYYRRPFSDFGGPDGAGWGTDLQRFWHLEELAGM